MRFSCLPPGTFSLDLLGFRVLYFPLFPLPCPSDRGIHKGILDD